jgi:hypothetical protein
MAFTGAHITCGYAGSSSSAGLLPLGRTPVWSQSMAAAGTTALGAPPVTSQGEPSFEVRAASDIYVAIGTTPDASQANGAGQSARMLIPANETRNIICSVGDKLAWILVP